MNYLYEYIHERRAFFYAFFLICLIWGLLFFLYGLEWEAYFYGGILMLIPLVLFFGLDFSRFYEKQRSYSQVAKLKNALFYDLSLLPASVFLKAMLEKIEADKKDFILQSQQEQELLEDYFTMWVHQIKLPISALGLLLENDPEQVKEMKMQLDRIDRYVGMVLAFLRMRSSSSDFVFREVKLDSIIQRSIRSFSTAFIYQKIPLRFDPTRLLVLSDEKWLGFVIDQILSNAIKYSNRQEIHIYHEKENLIIQDHGLGIAQADLSRIMEKGFTGENGRLMMEESSGLGLYLSKEIIQRLGHTLKIESKLNQGTKVILSLDRQDLEKE